jgi:hypothetical protein
MAAPPLHQGMEEWMQQQLAEHVNALNVQAHAWQAHLQEQAAAQILAAGAAAPLPQPQPEPVQPPYDVDGMPRIYRPEVLPKFYGKMGEEVDTWLCQVEEILGMNPIQNEDLRIRYVGMALRETAASWYASMRRADADERITDWASFIQKLRAQFITADPSWLARDGLHALRQKASVREYSVRFRELRLQIKNMSGTDALDTFIRGLKDVGFKVRRRKCATLREANRA